MMNRQYKFAIEKIASGHTVLIYHWPERDKVAHIRNPDRLALRDGVLYVDGVNAKGMSVVVKP